MGIPIIAVLLSLIALVIVALLSELQPHTAFTPLHSPTGTPILTLTPSASHCPHQSSHTQ